MSVRVQCPKCKTPHGVAERLLGRTIPCPECGAPLQLPTREVWEQVQERKRQRELAASSPQASQVAVVAEPVAAIATVKPENDSPAPKRPPPPKPAEEEEEDAPFEKPKNRDTTEMDMTPMIDVTFLLLIFFVVTASFQMQKALETPKSQSDAPSSKTVEQKEQIDEVTVQIDSNNTYMVITPDWEREVPGRQALLMALKEARAVAEQDSPMRLVIKAHVDSKHRAVVQALDVGAEARYTELQLKEVEEFE